MWVSKKIGKGVVYCELYILITDIYMFPIRYNIGHFLF
ncbi:MAG: hypothetical protein UY77_C0030G0013 [Candidatus Uhrbacteria bacterium GW2011_GWA2_53_10]|uniref:Uncharacterized protein n=1 Tax=Candidatus Uhrbacteria bacterium GW2011_GWA2_53_10 TaxID=1618980 RepID=A0A0G1ZVA0_9BACT|nr:MAG: hypothetical protein UY77_C0030G0013 [Candidatus Uhrbacteria bacterium GW2011_GWA2_53_10]